MEEAKSLLNAGDLNGAVQAALSVVKARPTDIAARTFLFELSLFSGDWERAERQLDAIGHQDVKAMVGSLIYRECLAAERKRSDYFAKSLKPEFLADPPDYIYGLLMANNRLREGNAAEALEILDKTEEDRPAFACTVNGQAMEDFRDLNDLTACVLEVFIKDSYLWVPLEQVVKITFQEPKSLRDLFWMQAELETANGTNGEVLVPALYADSYRHDNDQIRLGRATDWRGAGEEIYIGEGTKLFWMEGKDVPILDLREVVFTEAE
jgi:type VI secretion system protein ImpE